MKRNIDLFVLNGTELLSRYERYQLTNNQPIILDNDLLQCTNTYRESALLFQIRQVLGKHLTPTLFLDQIFYVDFKPLFSKHKSDSTMFAVFETLLTEGVTLQMDEDADPVRYVPFEKSQSQAKDCVISFIRHELFAPVRRRLDLDICFGDWNCNSSGSLSYRSKKQPRLSKLYAYRGLYLSDAARIEGIDGLLNPERIIVLDDEFIEPISDTWIPEVFSVNTQEHYPAGLDVPLTETRTQRKHLAIGQVFDGVGLISPRGAALINKGLYPDTFNLPDGEDDEQILRAMCQNPENADFSFQFRLPFCKGMLHTVNFRSFLTEIGCSSFLIEDAFGIQRDLLKAEIILNKSLFKLFSLLGYVKSDWIRMKDAVPLLDPMQYYFDKIQEYRHSLYIAKTDRNFRGNGFTSLNYQFLNTLDLHQTVFDGLVQRHIDRASQCRVSSIILKQGDLPFIRENPGETWVKYVKADYRLAVDPYVESLINSCRQSKLNQLLEGHLDVEGQIRFLSRDLIHYLCCIAHRAGTQPGQARRCCLRRGQLYMPGKKNVQDCAVFRSPHLSSNENVLATVVPGSMWHKKYLNHLRRVVMVSANSYIPNALGGADFDGDFVNLVFNRDVVAACHGNSYCESGEGESNSLPFIYIPSLNPDCSTEKAPDPSTLSNYVNVQTIRGTFSNRVGHISNMALKICAAEAACGDTDQLPFSSALCTILTGVEIDAAKCGLRPDLEPVDAFIANPPDGPAGDAIRAAANYISTIRDLKKAGLSELTVKKISDSRYSVTNRSGRKEIATIDLVPNAPLLTQLLFLWAKAREADTEADPNHQAFIDHLSIQLSGKKSDTGKKNVPVKKTLTKLVFRNADIHQKYPREDFVDPILTAYSAAMQSYRSSHIAELYQQKKECLARATTILKMQHDDIDASHGSGSVRSQGNRLFERALQELNTSERSMDILHDLFTDGQAEDLWLYQKEENRLAVLGEYGLDKMEYAQLLTDYRAKGYNLLYYVLRSAYSKAEIEQRILAMSETPGNTYYHRYCHLLAEAMLGRRTDSAAKQMLLAHCRQDLNTAAAEQGIIDSSTLFRMIYPPKNNQHNILWQMFDWNEIKQCISGDHYAE